MGANKMILFQNTLNINNKSKYVFLPAGINPAINEWLFWVGPNLRNLAIGLQDLENTTSRLLLLINDRNNHKETVRNISLKR